MATSKVGVVKLSVGVVSAGSSSLASESGDSLRDSISDSCATYFVNSSKLTLPSSSARGWGKWVWKVGGVSKFLLVQPIIPLNALDGAGILVRQ